MVVHRPHPYITESISSLIINTDCHMSLVLAIHGTACVAEHALYAASENGLVSRLCCESSLLLFSSASIICIDCHNSKYTCLSHIAAVVDPEP